MNTPLYVVLYNSDVSDDTNYLCTRGRDGGDYLTTELCKAEVFTLDGLAEMEVVLRTLHESGILKIYELGVAETLTVKDVLREYWVERKRQAEQKLATLDEDEDREAHTGKRPKRQNRDRNSVFNPMLK